MGAIADAWDILTGLLEDAGLTVYQNPGDVTPPCILLEPPSFSIPNKATVDCVFPATIVAPPPGDETAVRTLVDMADTIAALPEVLGTTGNPSVYEYGDRQMPAYTLNINLTVTR
jgi:hypothetical protein